MGAHLKGNKGLKGGKLREKTKWDTQEEWGVRAAVAENEPTIGIGEGSKKTN